MSLSGIIASDECISFKKDDILAQWNVSSYNKYVNNNNLICLKEINY